ncbi:hypothetical protein VTO73DRAFT_6058 [Trametes versicolor]
MRHFVLSIFPVPASVLSCPPHRSVMCSISRPAPSVHHHDLSSLGLACACCEAARPAQHCTTTAYSPWHHAPLLPCRRPPSTLRESPRAADADYPRPSYRSMTPATFPFPFLLLLASLFTFMVVLMSGCVWIVVMTYAVSPLFRVSPIFPPYPSTVRPASLPLHVLVP